MCKEHIYKSRYTHLQIHTAYCYVLVGFGAVVAPLVLSIDNDDANSVQIPKEPRRSPWSMALIEKTYHTRTHTHANNKSYLDAIYGENIDKLHDLRVDFDSEPCGYAKHLTHQRLEGDQAVVVTRVLRGNRDTLKISVIKTVPLGSFEWLWMLP